MGRICQSERKASLHTIIGFKTAYNFLSNIQRRPFMKPGRIVMWISVLCVYDLERVYLMASLFLQPFKLYESQVNVKAILCPNPCCATRIWVLLVISYSFPVDRTILPVHDELIPAILDLAKNKYTFQMLRRCLERRESAGISRYFKLSQRSPAGCIDV